MKQHLSKLVRQHPLPLKSCRLWRTILYASASLMLLSIAHATSNYTYKPGEYVPIKNGISPDRQYSIAAHGEGDYGDENFHLYLMNARTGKTIGVLEEIQDTLDTGPDAFYAKWSADSHQVSIRYRVDRHEAVVVRYKVENGRAYHLSGPTKTDKLSDN